MGFEIDQDKLYIIKTIIEKHNYEFSERENDEYIMYYL